MTRWTVWCAPSPEVRSSSTMLRIRNRPQPRGVCRPATLASRSGSVASGIGRSPLWSVTATSRSATEAVTRTATGSSAWCWLPCSAAFMTASATAVLSCSRRAVGSRSSLATAAATRSTAPRSAPASLGTVNSSRTRGVAVPPRRCRVTRVMSSSCSQPGQLGQQPVDQGLAAARMGAQLGEPRETEHLTVGRVRLGQPVGVQEQAVAGLKGRFAFLVAHAGQQPKRHAGGAQVGDLALAVQVGQVVAGVGEAQPAACRVEDRVQAGGEHVRGHLVDQQLVGALQHFCGVDQPRRLGPQHRMGGRHHQRGRHALVGDVAHHDPGLPAGQFDEVVEVSADRSSRLVVGGHLPAGQVGQLAGQELLLDELGDLEFLLDPLALAQLDLLLAHELRHPDGRGGMRGQVVEELAVVVRVVLLAAARPEAQQADQLALAHQRYGQARALGAQRRERRGVQFEPVQVDGAVPAGEVGEQGIVGGDVQLHHRGLGPGSVRCARRIGDRRSRVGRPCGERRAPPAPTSAPVRGSRHLETSGRSSSWASSPKRYDAADAHSGSLSAVPPTANGVVIPSYIRWVTSPWVACGRSWQWSIQMPGLSATKAISYDSPLPTLSESTHQGLPVAGIPLRLSTTAWCPCRCIGWTAPLWLAMRMRTTSPSATMNIGTCGNRWPLTVHQIPGRPSRKPGRRPMSYRNRRSGLCGSTPSGAVVPSESRSSVAFGRGTAGTSYDLEPSTTAAEPPRWTRTGEPSAGMVTSTLARPPAVTSRNGAPATHTDIGPFSVSMTRTRARPPGGASTRMSPSRPLTVRAPRYRCTSATTSTTPAGRAGGVTTRAPNRPPLTCLWDT